MSPSPRAYIVLYCIVFAGTEPYELQSTPAITDDQNLARVWYKKYAKKHAKINQVSCYIHMNRRYMNQLQYKTP